MGWNLESFSPHKLSSSDVDNPFTIHNLLFDVFSNSPHNPSIYSPSLFSLSEDFNEKKKKKNLQTPAMILQNNSDSDLLSCETKSPATATAAGSAGDLAVDKLQTLSTQTADDKGCCDGVNKLLQTQSCGVRERLKRHREEVAGKVTVPEKWGKEDLLKDWIDYSAFDRILAAGRIASARASLVAEGRRASSRALRVESRC